MLQVQLMEAICEEVARRMNPVLAELFATKQELAEVVAKAAVDNEELRAEHNKMLAAGQETLLLLQNAKDLEEKFATMQALVAAQVHTDVASEVGSGIQVSAALEEAIARNEAGIRAQFAHAELTAKTHVRREIEKLEAEIRRTAGPSAADASAAGTEAATPVSAPGGGGQATSSPQATHPL